MQPQSALYTPGLMRKLFVVTWFLSQHSWTGEDHFPWFAQSRELQDVVLPWLAGHWNAEG